MNSISLDADMKAQLGLDKCEVGKEETVTITINPTSVQDGLEADVTGGEGYDEPEPPEAKPAPAAPPKPKRPRAVDMAMQGNY